MIPVCKPCWNGDEETAALNVMRSGRLIQGPEVQRFESLVADFVGVNHAIACSSGTMALHLALMAMGVKRSDEVLVPAFTFVATANAVLACGAKPVLCDIDLDTFCIDPPRWIRIDQKMISVECFGIQSRHVGILEDAACALSDNFKLRGLAATFSFHATKTITTGEGGMVVTNDLDLAEKCRFLRDQKHALGMAYNYRMTEIQGAIGCAQMQKLPWILERRAEIAAEYDVAFNTKIHARIPPKGNYQSYVLLLDPTKDRTAVIKALASKGVEALPGTQFLGDMPHLKTDGLPKARFAGTHAMRIPCYPTMTSEEVQTVVQAVMEVLG